MNDKWSSSPDKISALLPDYPINAPIPIPKDGTWPSSVHVFDADTIAALHAAEITGRPLLLRGDPGTGKSETARAAAAAAGRPFVSVVIDGRTEPTDLKWRFDAVARLADAQVTKKDRALLGERAYLLPGPLWWAYAWEDAESQLKEVEQKRKQEQVRPGIRPDNWNPKSDRVVLLIDEIDKADPDLPNAMLEVLANLGFREPYGGTEISCFEATRPLVIITTNEERELPHAFLRRCLVHRLELPDERGALIDWLVKVGVRHQEAPDWQGHCSEDVMKQAADYVADAREHLADTGRYLPGTSEFLDMIKVLAATPSSKLDERLKQLKQLALNKGGGRHR
ncbi:AAA family ATPase [Zoogloea sp.]|uniref:AAA family ATPase n=1 Tax=Zoogloea sp. TaxID=49181 RepID=UPI0035B494A0